jgi:hypothetical protein
MIKYSNAYAETIARAHLDQDEQILAKAAGVHRPWYTGGFVWFWKFYYVVATNKRLLLCEHRRGLFYDRLEAVHSVPWNELNQVKVAGLLLKKTLKIQWAGSKLALRLPRLLSPTPANIVNAKHVATTWNQAKQLPAPAAPASLPAPQQPVYGQQPAAAGYQYQA